MVGLGGGVGKWKLKGEGGRGEINGRGGDGRGSKGWRGERGKKGWWRSGGETMGAKDGGGGRMDGGFKPRYLLCTVLNVFYYTLRVTYLCYLPTTFTYDLPLTAWLRFSSFTVYRFAGVLYCTEYSRTYLLVQSTSNGGG